MNEEFEIMCKEISWYGTEEPHIFFQNLIAYILLNITESRASYYSDKSYFIFIAN
jgi:hypothetical protein